MEGNDQSKNEDETFFKVFLLIHDPILNFYTVKDVCLRFPSIIWTLQFLRLSTQSR